MAVNPQPVTDVGNDPAARNWAALNQDGMIMVSHGLKVPHDTPDQPPRPWVSDAPGSWASPRWGLFSLTVNAYQPSVGRQLMVYDWDPGDLKGYAFDSYGALWPFGSDTPMAATGPLGAPFGAQQFNPQNTGLTYVNCFQMHSANGLPFGLGGWPDGFGWMLTAEGAIVDWGGVMTMQNPVDTLPTTGWTGVFGSGLNRTRDFKMNPDGSGQYFVLYDGGFIYSGTAVGLSNQRAIDTSYRAQPSSNVDDVAGYRWMHVDWGFAATGGGWIIAMTNNGTLEPYKLVGGSVPPAVPFPVPWLNVTNGPSPSFPGWWQYGDIVPGRNPTRFYMINAIGGAFGPAITGTIQALAPTVANITTTTRPTISWTYDEKVGATSVSSQKAYNVRVYPTAVTTAGGFVAGQNQGAVWISDRAQVVTAPGTGSDVINTDLVNGAQYKAYVRVTSAGGVQSAWAIATFTMAIPTPAAPSSCTATPTPGTYPTTFGSVSVNAGGALPSGCLRQFQVSAENGAWEDVIGAAATATNPVTDLYPPTSVNLTYRVRNFKRVPATIASAWTISADTTLNPSSGQPPYGWYLIDTQGLIGPSRVQLRVTKWSKTDVELAGEFYPLTRNAAVKTTAGVKGSLHAVTIVLTSAAQSQTLAALLKVTGRPLLFETGINGQRWWVSPRPGTWEQTLTAPTAYKRDVDLELLEVVRPS